MSTQATDETVDCIRETSSEEAAASEADTLKDRPSRRPPKLLVDHQNFTLHIKWNASQRSLATMQQEMSGVELGLAIAATVDICLNRGKRLIELYAASKGAENEIKERFTRVRASWLQIEMQLEFIKRVEFLMDERHRIVQESLVEVLLGKLEIVASKLEKVTVTDGQDNIDLLNKSMAQMTPKRFKYAWLKESLDKAIESFEYWQRRFDPSWYLLLRIGDSQIDAALSEASGATKQLLPSTRVIRESSEEEREQEKVPVFLQSVELQALTVNKIPFSEASEAQRLNSQGSVRNMILSNIHCHPGANVVRAMRDVRDLARKLQHGDPRTFGLLDCKGVVKEVDVSKPIQSTYFTLVFRTPIGFEKPRSLRECLMSENEDNSLSDKVSIAQELAKSVNYVHVFGFVHKNIRPETVLTFSSSEGNVSSAAFLVGFDNFRNEQGQTYLRGDDAWEKNLYRHPSRQGNDPIEEYSMQHDIYSLGVCLLEIGLWVSFVSYDEKGLNPLPSAALELSLEDGGLRSPAALKDHLVALAKRRLPRCVGRKYAEVVETCLTCLDPDNTDFGDESKFLDENGILVGVRYIEKVLSNLDSISV